jgi:hypothetical protein
LPEPFEEAKWMGGLPSFFCVFNDGLLLRAALVLSAFRAGDTFALDCSTRRNSCEAEVREAGSLPVPVRALFLLLSLSSLCEGFAFGFWSFWAEESSVNPATANASITENLIYLP